MVGLSLDKIILRHKISRANHEKRPWIVLINGLFADLSSWNSIMSFLERDFNILRYDGRYQGADQGFCGPLSLEQQVHDLKNLLDHLNIDQTYLIGLSNGGRIGLEFTRLYPQSVEALVACDTYNEITPLLKAKLNSWLEANRIGGGVHRFDVASPWVWGESILLEHPHLVQLYRERANDMDSASVEALILSAMEEYTIDLDEVKRPVLLIVGNEDLLTPPFKHFEMVKKLPSGELKVVKGGHASLLEYPSSMGDTVLPFLRKLICKNQESSCLG